MMKTKLLIVLVAVLVFGFTTFSYAADPTLAYMDVVRTRIDNCFRDQEITKEVAHNLRTQLATTRESIGPYFKNQKERQRVANEAEKVNNQLPKTCK
jgi:hypothetical protein